MTKNRLEAFSDGVLAVIITIMVLEMKSPHGASPADLKPLVPVFLSYVLSFVYIGIYWNNHHHLLHAIQRVNGATLWANLHLLFWLSLVPFTTTWMGENHFEPWPAAVYGIVLRGAAAAYQILTIVLVRLHGPQAVITRSLGADWKGKLSLLIYCIAVPLAFVRPWMAGACYALVAVIWFVPDRRLEHANSARE
jgi:uncharacterized membrane protein